MYSKQWLSGLVIIRSRGFNYGSNIHNRTYPKGLDCEIFNFNELERAHFNSNEDREHVTPYIKAHSMNIFSLEDDQNFAKKRITLDYDFDYSDLSSYAIDKVYDYPTLKLMLKDIVSTEDYFTKIELGRV